MKCAALAGLMVCVLPATSVATAQSAHSVNAVTHSLYSAISRSDTTVLRGLLSEDLRWVSGSSGAVVTKRQLLAAASQPIPDIRLDYQLDSVTTWERGAVAGADYILANSRTFRDYRTVFIARASDTYAREEGRWQLLRHVQTWLVHSPDTTALDSLQLAAFVGRYDRGHGYVDDVHFKDGHLVAQSTYEALRGVPGADLFPASRDTFSPERFAPMIVFERDEQGQGIGYVQQQPDSRSRATARASVNANRVT